VSLKPGGYHIMLMGLSAPLKEGDSFPLSLTFAHAGSTTVTVKVKGAGDTGMSMDHMDMSHGSGQ
jgi:copper(I)-binding protein